MVLNQHTPSMDNWMGHKQEGAMRYQRGEYDLALASFRASLNPEFSVTCPSAEKQIILSNIVACRLKLGGPAQSEAAVEDAKQVKKHEYELEEFFFPNLEKSSYGTFLVRFCMSF